MTAEPRTTANTGCPSRRASASRSSTSIPAPSANPVPSAAPAYALQRPSGDSARCRLNSTNIAGEAITVTPPANTKSHSPDRNDCAPRCIATNDDEHAVSTDTAGPSRPSTYATRPDATLNVEPRIPYLSRSPGTRPWPPYEPWNTPANTPVAEPRNPVGSIPARSNASHDTSNNKRCCGSIARASLGAMPKNAASKPATSARNPPAREYDFPTASGSGSNSPAKSQPRSAGKSDTASRPATTISHKLSGESTPPGYRQAMPTTATGSAGRSVIKDRYSRFRRFSRSFSFKAVRSAATSSS